MLHKLLKKNISNNSFRNEFINYILKEEQWNINDIGFSAGHKFEVIDIDINKSIVIKFLNNKIEKTESYFISKNYDKYTNKELTLIFTKLSNCDYKHNLNSATYRFLIKTKLSKKQIFKFKNQLNFNYIINDYPEYKNSFIRLLFQLINEIPPQIYFEELKKSNKNVTNEFIALNYTNVELLNYMIYAFTSHKGKLYPSNLLKIFEYLSKREINCLPIFLSLNDEIIKKILDKLSLFDSEEKISLINSIKKHQLNNISDSMKNQILILEKLHAI